jgi:hypothetical protein
MAGWTWLVRDTRNINKELQFSWICQIHHDCEVQLSALCGEIREVSHRAMKS